ncbi:Mss4-like protein [Auriculariales sp. MPI-PUGE-AT-0066]|nr:Mss4-like protein [Auriculariales sp. MPI-PUGE-AT-0066]
MSTVPTTETKTYHGSCHCGAFKFAVTVPEELKKASTCTCSICSKKATLWTSYLTLTPEEGTQESSLRTYTFNDKKAQHKFCPTCATSLVCEIPAYNMQVINVRTFSDLDFRKLEIGSYDGAALPPAYVPPKYTGPEVVPGEGEKLYTGSCHCGALTLALRSKPLPDVAVKECNCTICTKDSYILAYPNKDQVSLAVSSDHPDGLKEYMFGPHTLAHQFCGICGVPIAIRVVGPPKAAIDGMSEAGKAIVEKKLQIRPINLHVLDGVEWDSLKITRDFD